MKSFLFSLLKLYNKCKNRSFNKEEIIYNDDVNTYIYDNLEGNGFG